MIVACDIVAEEDDGEEVGLPASPSISTEPENAQLPSVALEPVAPSTSTEALADKWFLWIDGPLLRGANIWQAVVVPDLDGLEFKGQGPVGPPYFQEDFNRLAALGANYVSISGPGLFAETPPLKLMPAYRITWTIC